MQYLLTLTLLAIVITGCSSRSNTGKPDIADVAPEGRLTEVAPTEAASSLPVTTANPTAIPLKPMRGNTPAPSTTIPTGNWQTFTSTALGVTVNYPPDWSVSEETGAVIFTSPKGATIQLKPDTTNRSNKGFKTGNQYCTSRANEHGQTAEVCVDRASFTYSARFAIQKADSSIQQVTLTTKTRTAGEVFEAMFNSLQPTT